MTHTILMDLHRVRHASEGCYPVSHVSAAVARGLLSRVRNEFAGSEHRERDMCANRPQREIEIDKDGEEDTETERPSASPRPPRKLTFARRAHYPRDHTFLFHCTYDTSKNLHKFSPLTIEGF